MDVRRALATTPLEKADDFAQCLMEGLAKTPKEIACKYFYDAEGSRLFDAICELPEYYQARTETALLARHAGEIARLIGPKAELLEFGAGALKKVRQLLNVLEDPAGYTPIDISGDYLIAVTRALAADYPNLALRPQIADFTRSLAIPPLPGARRRVGFFPGSTIGNFTPDEALGLLHRMRLALNGGGLLIGVDLIKDPALLHAAYNDTAGVTAAFNKNLLARANSELEADFNLAAFSHYAPYNPVAARIEMYLVSLEAQRVRIGGKTIEFSAGEAIHTENSHKYTVESFQALAARAGFFPTAVWCDAKSLFSLHWLEGQLSRP